MLVPKYPIIFINQRVPLYFVDCRGIKKNGEEEISTIKNTGRLVGDRFLSENDPSHLLKYESSLSSSGM